MAHLKWSRGPGGQSYDTTGVRFVTAAQEGKERRLRDELSGAGARKRRAAVTLPKLKFLERKELI